MHEIQGPLNVSINVQYVYSVTPADGLGYLWTVSGCEIVSGQGTSSITVLWTISGQGSIQVDVSTSGGHDIVIIDPTSA